MVKDVKTTLDTRDIFELCTPITSSTSALASDTRLLPLAKRGLGYTGTKSLPLACIFLKETNQYGGFQGETLHPVTADIQQDPRVSRLIRAVKFHSTLSATGETGLLYYKPPIPGLPPNTWLASAQQAVHASVECWGHFTSDNIAEAYRFIPAVDQLPAPDKLADPRDLIQEILGDRVITSMDHPAIQRLCGYSPAPMGPDLDEEDDESAY
jgi:hypothetical protein